MRPARRGPTRRYGEEWSGILPPRGASPSVPQGRFPGGKVRRGGPPPKEARSAGASPRPRRASPGHGRLPPVACERRGVDPTEGQPGDSRGAGLSAAKQAGTCSARTCVFIMPHVGHFCPIVKRAVPTPRAARWRSPPRGGDCAQGRAAPQGCLGRRGQPSAAASIPGPRPPSPRCLRETRGRSHGSPAGR